jgi:hypothetical protein
MNSFELISPSPARSPAAKTATATGKSAASEATTKTAAGTSAPEASSEAPREKDITATARRIDRAPATVTALNDNDQDHDENDPKDERSGRITLEGIFFGHGFA